VTLVSCESNRLTEHHNHMFFDLGEVICETATGNISCSDDSKLIELYGTLTSSVYVKQLPYYFNSLESIDILRGYLEKQNTVDFLATMSFLDLDEGKKVLIYDLPEGEMLRSYLNRQNSSIDYQQAAFLLVQLKDMLEQLALVDMQHGRIEVDSIYISKEGYLYLLDSAIIAAKHELIKREIIPFQMVPNKEAITASPELCFGREITVEDNVFNLSLLAYQLIYSSHPYGGENSIQALVNKYQAVRCGMMSDDQWNIFRKGLSLRASDRFSSLSELIEALLCVNNPNGSKFRLVMEESSFFANKLWLMILASLGGISGAVLMSQLLASS